MISFARRQSSCRFQSRRWFRPQLEHLETRYCPTGPVIAIGSLSAIPEAARVVHVSGTVTVQNDTPSNCAVNLSGVVSGTLSVHSDGTFSADLTATGPGQITGVASDAQLPATSLPATV